MASMLLCPALVMSGCTHHATTKPVAKTGDTSAAKVAAVTPSKDLGTVEYEQETLPNGLRVIYAPLRQAPVVHVRVVYHVGSRDENPERQGFAHMFEHMMFRGSQHVPPEQHMKIVDDVGGSINAFTSNDQTTYHQSVPATALETVLYLEADRMSSFKVKEEIFQTERKVVAEEWRRNYANRPTGFLFPDFLRTAYTTHPYRWSTIGDMDQLRQSTVAELQQFWNTYYVPNNACLVIAGDFDVAKTKQLVRKYYGWIKQGATPPRNFGQEPEQTEQRKLVVYRRGVPLPTILIGYKTEAYASDAHDALDAAADIIGSGRTSRLSKLLVNSGKPVAVGAGAGSSQLQDTGYFTVSASVLPGNEADAVEAELFAAVKEFADNGPTPAELERYKTQSRQAIIRGRETAEQIARRLGEEEVFGGSAGRVNQALAKVEALTTTQVRDAARKYLQPQRATIVQYLPDPTGSKGRTIDTSKADETAKAAVVASSEPVAWKDVAFPANYPTKVPAGESKLNAKFNHGMVTTVNGVKVIVVEDHRIPVVNFSLLLRGGSDAEPVGKEGLGGLTAAMMRRGSTGEGGDFQQLAEDLESKSIGVEVGDGGDSTRLTGSAPTPQVGHMIDKARQVLLQPAFPEAEFIKLKNQAIANEKSGLAQAAGVAGRELRAALWAGTPQGRLSTPKTLDSITLDDVKKYYADTYRSGDAILVFSGDITPAAATALAAKLTAGLPAGKPPQADYTAKPLPAGRRIILVDNPDGRQSAIRVGWRAFTIKSDERYAGSVATQVLSAGLGARMNMYLRVERGLTYGAGASFGPGRNFGSFGATTDTNPATTGASVEGIYTVLSKMRDADVTPEELASSRTRVAGSMVLQMQTVRSQADQRLSAEINGWPADYFEKYPARIAQVTAAEVRKVMNDYVLDDRSVVVVVGPADRIKEQLTPFGNVEVVPMPLKREGVLPSGSAAAE